MSVVPGTLYLVPSPLGEGELDRVIPSKVAELLCSLQLFFAEELRTVRRYLSKAGLKGKLDSVQMFELNEHTGLQEIEGYLNMLLEGRDAALVSEAGLPAVADPGAQLVALAHKYDVRVVPLSGPSSLMMALMSSGLNGQCFAFHGYLPIEAEKRKKKIHELERVASMKQTQIFIETPYRNNKLMADLCNSLAGNLRLCVACDLTSENEQITTRTIAEWRKSEYDYGKRPAIFLLCQ